MKVSQTFDDMTRYHIVQTDTDTYLNRATQGQSITVIIDNRDVLCDHRLLFILRENLSSFQGC